MSGQDCELTRLRVDLEMKLAVEEAARRMGITASAWRKVQYAKALTEQLGPRWRKGRGSGDNVVGDQGA